MPKITTTTTRHPSNKLLTIMKLLRRLKKQMIKLLSMQVLIVKLKKKLLMVKMVNQV